ncbi:MULTISPECIES: patatin-like phospholipase family protein [unclassified Marichromatium]|uniref:patatin-like phospholipase family protein n=1 Tax=unclassified Marichromatium TaxID=2618417 RepID=UPI000F3DCA08|nr:MULTISPECIES: patatin-like phospholipase family protein [unclassified Marichromatium]MBO8084454.1 patatin-like phospholipase family protein [Marichromatium sp.]RNE90809.1 patatin [Marichromatium sp. AB31]RNE94420.1 patatin [Marichromatium sp. AB32]
MRTTVAILLTLLGLAAPALAETRPAIGLALSGGGARGAAHVGVLRELERRRIPIDYIAGTSMGAVVGGLYAMGMSPDEIERTIEDIDWTAIFQDEPARATRRMQRKLEDRSFLIKSRPGVDEEAGRVNLVPALIQGQRLELALREYTLPATAIHDFDRLRIPFRAIATDVVSGEAVVLGGGDLATAIRASMAVPAVFAPVEIGERLLVDGGLAMNLPIGVVREMGAEIVIAVDIGGPRRDRESITDVLEMLDQVASLVTWRNTQAEIATLGPRDLLLTPPLGRRVLASDFDKMLEAIAIGEQAARATGAPLDALALPAARYAAYRQAHRRADYQAPVITRLGIDNDSGLDDAVLARRIQVTPGERFDPETLAEQIERVYDQDVFETVRYRIEPEPGDDERAALHISAREKRWGTSSLQGGLELSSSGGGNSRFNLGAAYTKAPLTDLNGEWRTEIRLGEEPGILSNLYLPLDPAERWFAGLGVGYLSESLTLFDPSAQDAPLAEYQLNRFGANVKLGRNLGDWGRIALGYAHYRGDADLRVGDPGFGGYNFDVGALEFRFDIDTLDSANFPASGWAASAFGEHSRTALGATSNYDQAGIELVHALGRGRHRLITALTLAGNFGGETPLHAYYRLGGFLNLSGFNQLELSGANLGLARAIYLHAFDTGLVPTYAGASLEVGNTWARRGDIGADSLRLGSSLFLGADTPIGPLYLGYGYADGGNDALYLFLGRPWNRALIH